jgi:hypothetical protein
MIKRLLFPRPEVPPVHRLIAASALFASIVFLASSSVAQPPADSPGAKITREKRLKAKISIEVKDLMLREIISELKGALKDAGVGDVRIQTGPGVTLTSRFSLKAKEEPFEDVLDKLLKEREWGYYVIVGKSGDQSDGAIMLISEPARGYPPDAEGKGKTAEKPKKDAEKKETAKVKPEDPKKKEPPSDANKDERTAKGRLGLAESWLADNKPDKAKPILEEIIKKYPSTKAAEEAKKLLEKLKK